MNRERIADLFEQAVELPEDARTALLETACAGDAELRAEVERLLRADARAANFLERPPPMVAAAIDASAHSGDALPVFGAWRTLRQIGVGGMGEVWLAERGDGQFEQRVAIKQLAYPTPGLMQRFRQPSQHWLVGIGGDAVDDQLMASDANYAFMAQISSSPGVEPTNGLSAGIA